MRSLPVSLVSLLSGYRTSVRLPVEQSIQCLKRRLACRQVAAAGPPCVCRDAESRFSRIIQQAAPGGVLSPSKGYSDGSMWCSGRLRPCCE